MAKVVKTGYTATLSARWAGEGRGKDTLVRGGARLDPAQFYAEDSVFVDVAAAGAAAGATTIPLGTALSGPIPSGTTLDFGTNKYATLTSAAAAAATSLTVRAIPTALVDADTARYVGTKKKLVKNGTVLGRTFAEAAAGTAFGPAADADDQVYILAFDVIDADSVPDVELYRYGKLVKTNFLPDWAVLSTALKAKVRANYETVERGVA